jgi:hypothetical protein
MDDKGTPTWTGTRHHLNNCRYSARGTDGLAAVAATGCGFMSNDDADDEEEKARLPTVGERPMMRIGRLTPVVVARGVGRRLR